jgi:hypothetical protein
MQIFVSHDSRDRNHYVDLCQRLVASEVPYWDAGSMPAGATLQEKLREGIKVCDACIFVATDNSVDSQWCLAELGAFWGAGKPVIPYVAGDDVAEKRLPPYLRELVWARSAESAVHDACHAARQRRRDYPAVLVTSYPNDGDSLVEIKRLLESARGRFTTARLIQYSAAHAVPLLEVLSDWRVSVQMLLIHPAQLLINQNYPLMDFQLSKLRTFHSSPDFGENIEVRYYLQPASLRGIAVPNVMCAVGWYTHEEYWLYGHRNATVIAQGPDVGTTGLWEMFARVFSAMWSNAIAEQDDARNLSRLLTMSLADDHAQTRLDGIVVRGHGIASGSTCDGPGTLAQQSEYLSKHIDLQKFWHGTINVSVSPRAVVWKSKTPTLSRVRWSDHQPPEDFCLAPCEIEVLGTRYSAYVYYPHPRTKTQNFQSPSIIEIIAPRLDALSYGSAVTVYLDNSMFAVW